MGTVLSFGAEVLRSSRGPARMQVEPLGVHIVTKDSLTGMAVHHGRGLLPAFPSRKTLILTPCKGFSGWGVRTLTWEELLQSLDIGDRFIPLLPEAFDLSKFTPIGMVVEALERIDSLLPEIRGGYFPLSPPLGSKVKVGLGRKGVLRR